MDQDPLTPPPGPGDIDDDLKGLDGSLQTPEDLLLLKGKAADQIQQFGHFLKIMEARMTSLEDKLSGVKGSELNLEPMEFKEEPASVPEVSGEGVSLQPGHDSIHEPICEIKTGDMAFFDRAAIPVPSQNAYGIPPGPLPFSSGLGDPTPLDLPIQSHTTIAFNQSKNPERWVIEVLIGADIPKPSQLREHVHPAGIGESTPIEQRQHDKLDTSKIHSCERVRIRSEVLLAYLSELNKENLARYGETVVFLKPFKFLTKHENAIRVRVEELSSQAEANEGEGASSNSESPVVSEERRTSEAKLLSHLRLLVDLYDSYLKPTTQQYHELTTKTATHVAFDNLYYLFNYGQEVICMDEPNQLYRLYAFGGGRELIGSKDTHNPPPAFIVDCYRYATDGVSYGPVAPPRQPSIGRYTGYREITSLPIYPLEFHPKAEEFRKRAVQRGAQYIEMSSKKNVIHRQYTGMSLDEQPEEIDSQVIIDESMAILHNTKWFPTLGISSSTNFNDLECSEKCSCTLSCGAIFKHDYHQDLEDDKLRASEYFSEHKYALQPPEDTVEPPEEDHVLLPHFMYGFVLRSRKWAKLSLDLLSPIEYKNSFDRLVLPDGHAEAVRALVQNHNRGPKSEIEDKSIDMAMDLVRGKGKGLIILLHGEPGVGKTSTAETIADFTKRPLYPITCGDIGSQAEKVEENLERTFQLAHKWGCVLLLDEADVFLQERARDDIERNAIVSVFLRVMEYYSGILFLTTNRVGTLDQAFRSRIHLSLYYPALSEEVTIQIWKMNIETAKQLFEEKDKDIRIDDEDILRFAKKHYREMEDSGLGVWNGRQIRNAFQTALALSRMKAVKSGRRLELTDEQFKTVAKTSKAFDDYLLKTQGGTSTRLAKMHKLRNDEVHTRRDDDRLYKKSHAKQSRATTRRSRRHESSEEETSDSSSSSESEEERKKSRRKSKPSHKEKTKKKVKNEEIEGQSSVEDKPAKEKKEKEKKKKNSKKRDDDDDD